jgi:hypothetical protein
MAETYRELTLIGRDARVGVADMHSLPCELSAARSASEQFADLLHEIRVQPTLILLQGVGAVGDGTL